ncbi:SCO family protein [Lampropedia puyangensis]|nr:SCO family protein [Lampropedia puyangensis]
MSLLLQACSDEAARSSRTAFHSHDITGAAYGGNWRMPDTSGAWVDQSILQGKLSYIFFGFAQCPDVCPTTMLELAQVKAALGEQGQDLQVIFVTVDPERDTPEIMRAYLDSFDTHAIGLVGSPQELATMAREFKVFYQKVPVGDDGLYTMDHSAGGYIFDRNGTLRLYAPYGMAVQNLTQDMQQLLND